MSPDRSDIEALLREGRLRPQQPDVPSLTAVLVAARGDVAAADSIKPTSAAWAESILYEAGLRAARVIVQANGFRIAAERGHVTAIDAADALTEGRLHRRFARLHRMRRTRHGFMYEVGRVPSDADLVQAYADVEALLVLAEAAVRGVAG